MLPSVPSLRRSVNTLADVRITDSDTADQRASQGAGTHTECVRPGEGRTEARA